MSCELREMVSRILAGEHLATIDIAKVLLQSIGKGKDELLATLLLLLEKEGVTSSLLTHVVRALRKSMVSASVSGKVLDIVGTGGDGAGTLNISSAAAILAASCGVPVVKHGGRAVSSRCGSVDAMEALGVSLATDPAMVEVQLEEKAFAFCLAPAFHPLLRDVAPLRRKLGVRTLFNRMGPLLNPAGAGALVLGVGKRSDLEVIAQSLTELGCDAAYVFHCCGTDELSPLGVAEGFLLREGAMQPMDVDPGKLGFSSCRLAQLKGGDAAENAKAIEELFVSPSETAFADAIIMNAGMGLFIYGAVATLEEGIEAAREGLYSGKAALQLQRIRC
jgi:anthranilate phosphoribosyltransferase